MISITPHETDIVDSESVFSHVCYKCNSGNENATEAEAIAVG